MGFFSKLFYLFILLLFVTYGFSLLISSVETKTQQFQDLTKNLTPQIDTSLNFLNLSIDKLKKSFNLSSRSLESNPNINLEVEILKQIEELNRNCNNGN